MDGDAPTLFDVIIVGAGPAGSTAGIQLARAGWSVALVEKQAFPRRKVCGECIAASNLPLLESLGLGGALATLAGPELRHVALWRGRQDVTADLPAAPAAAHRFGRALGRETLDTLLVAQAWAAGAVTFQPGAVQAMRGTAGAWCCEVRMIETGKTLCLRSRLVIDAHGSWEDLPSQRAQRRSARRPADLFAFKANFRGASLPAGQISVLALPGGYGGMVVADGAVTTLACCVRRDRLGALRAAAPGASAALAVEAWLQRECHGVRQALQGATRDGPWLAAGPLSPGIKLGHAGQANAGQGGVGQGGVGQADADGIFRVGNAAGEAHPILGEGMSMALQSAALLCSHLLAGPDRRAVPDAAAQRRLQRAYAAAWRRQFAPRLRLAALFAHVAMRPGASAVLLTLARAWPGLLTDGARWGGKVRSVDVAPAAELAAAASPAPLVP